jgi:hypothetical protein
MAPSETLDHSAQSRRMVGFRLFPQLLMPAVASDRHEKAQVCIADTNMIGCDQLPRWGCDNTEAVSTRTEDMHRDPNRGGTVLKGPATLRCDFQRKICGRSDSSFSRSAAEVSCLRLGASAATRNRPLALPAGNCIT